ncbi:MAG: alpha/beta hydrolase [bacterium]|nr:alpha/beta hydrolase [bacterium]
MTGSSESEGSFEQTSLSSQVEDLKAASTFLEREYSPPKIAIGISLGGAIALQSVRDLPAVKAVVTINSPSDTRRLANFLSQLAPEIDFDGSADVTLLGKTTTIGRLLLEELESHNVGESVRRLQRPLLVCQAPDDEVVPVADGHHVFEIAQHPKSFLSIADGDHLLLKDRSLPSYVADIIATWTSRFL